MTTVNLRKSKNYRTNSVTNCFYFLFLDLKCYLFGILIIKENSNYKMVMRNTDPSEVKNYHHLDQATKLLKNAGIDLNKCAQNLRKLDKSRLLFQSLKRVVSRQQSAGLRHILETKIKKTRALENVNNRVKGRMMYAYNQLFKDNKTIEQHFYNWYVRSKPEILQRLSWNLIIKQKLTTSVAVSRLSYLIKFKTSRNKKSDYLKILKGLAMLKQFIEMRRVMDTKVSWDKLSPMNHNGKYFLLTRVWSRYMNRRRANLKGVMQVLTGQSAKIKRLLALLQQKTAFKHLEGFRNLRGFCRQEDNKEDLVRNRLESQKKEFLLNQFLQKSCDSGARWALAMLRSNNKRENTKNKFIWLMGKRSETKLHEAYQTLKAFNQMKEIEQKLEIFKKDNLNQNLERKKSSLSLLLVKGLRNRRQLALDKIRRVVRPGMGQKSKVQGPTSKLIEMLKNKIMSKKHAAFYNLLRLFGERYKEEKPEEKKKNKYGGELSKEGRDKFNNFVENLLEKPDLKNATIEKIKKFMIKRNGDGRYDKLLKKINKGNSKDISKVLKLLGEEAQKGDPLAGEIKDMLDIQEKFNMLNLGMFMEDENQNGKFNQLLDYMESNPDLRYTELSEITQTNNQKSQKLGDLLGELDERKEVDKILEYMEQNNEDQIYSDLIRFVKDGEPNLAQLLQKINSENSDGRFNRLKAFVNNKDKQIRDILRNNMILSNPHYNGIFDSALDILREGRKRGLEEIYQDIKTDLEKKRDDSRADDADKMMASVALRKLDDWVNGTEEREVDNLLDYLLHANNILKGRLNPVVNFFNEKIDREDEDLRMDQLFEFLDNEFGINGDTIDDPRSFSNEHEQLIFSDFRDLYRTFADGNRLRRCIKFIDERNGNGELEEIKSSVDKAKPRQFSKFIKLLKNFDSSEFPEVQQLEDLLNAEYNLKNLKEFIFGSNKGNQNKELLEFIKREKKDLTYLDLVHKVLELQKKGKARNVLRFIDRDSSFEWLAQAQQSVKNKLGLALSRQIENQLQQLKNNGQFKRDDVFQVLKNFNRGGELNVVLDEIEGKSETLPLIESIKRYLHSNGNDPNARSILEKLNKKVVRKSQQDPEEGKVRPFPELTDLIEVLHETPKLKEDFPQIERLLNERNKESRFEDTLNFIRDNNQNKNYTVLIRDLDPTLVGRTLNRRSNIEVREEHLPDTFRMAELLSKKYGEMPSRFEEVYSRFNEDHKLDTKKDIENYLHWMNKANENGDILQKIKDKNRRGLTYVLDVIKEENEELEDFFDVMDRVDEESISKENMIEFLKKYNSEGQKDEMLEFLESREDPKVSEVLEVANRLNKKVDLDNFLTFVKSGGVDIMRTGYASDDPLQRILTKFKLLGKFPEIFTLLTKRPELKNPVDLLNYLRRNNKDEKYEELIWELEKYIKKHLEYPDLGVYNEEHPLTKLVHKKMRNGFKKLREFNRRRKKAEKWLMILLGKNKEMQKMIVLKRFSEVIMGTKVREQLQINGERGVFGRLFESLKAQKHLAFKELREFTFNRDLTQRFASQLVKERFENAEKRRLLQSVSHLSKARNRRNRQKRAVSRLLRHFNDKGRIRAMSKWQEVVKHEKICRFSHKLNRMCFVLKKNHKIEQKEAFSRWSQKEMRMKFERMNQYLVSTQREKKQEMYFHMKILFMQKKFSKMCKVLGKFLEFVETRKRENMMYAFDAMSLDNPWAQKVPKLLACSRPRTAQMCFWKLRLTRHDFLKKRRQRGGGYKIDKLKLVILEKIFTKKISQYFMQIQIGRPNKYL